jgi:hypothetical protein
VLIGLNVGRSLSHQNEPDKRHDEGETHEEDRPTMGFRSWERFRCGAVIAAPPLARPPQVAISIILIHMGCSTLDRYAHLSSYPRRSQKESPNRAAQKSAFCPAFLFDKIDNYAILISVLRSNTERHN